MANNGKLESDFEGYTLLSEESHSNIHSDATREKLGRGGFITNFTKGGFAKFQDDQDPSLTEYERHCTDQLNKGREGYYGWMGLGGSIFQWNPELKISIAYVPFELNIHDLHNTRGKMLQQAVTDCVKGNPPTKIKSGTCEIF